MRCGTPVSNKKKVVVIQTLKHETPYIHARIMHGSMERLEWLDSCGVPVDVAIDTLLDYNPQTSCFDLDARFPVAAMRCFLCDFLFLPCPWIVHAYIAPLLPTVPLCACLFLSIMHACPRKPSPLPVVCSVESNVYIFICIYVCECTHDINVLAAVVCSARRSITSRGNSAVPVPDASRRCSSWLPGFHEMLVICTVPLNLCTFIFMYMYV